MVDNNKALVDTLVSGFNAVLQLMSQSSPASSAPLSSASDSLTRDNFVEYAKIKAGDDPLKQLMIRMCSRNPNCTGVAFESSDSRFG